MFRAGADRDAIESCMFTIASAFAAIEQILEKELESCPWEQKRLSSDEHYIVLRRSFPDPNYPQKFDAAFRHLSHTPEPASEERFH